MRKQLVEAALGAASAALFEDVLYTHAPADPVTIKGAIAGVEIVSERFEVYGQAVAECSHVTRALRSKFPDLARGDIIDDGTAYKVIAFEPIGDGRFEIVIGLKPI